jgi:hypothetical protein
VTKRKKKDLENVESKEDCKRKKDLLGSAY